MERFLGRDPTCDRKEARQKVPPISVSEGVEDLDYVFVSKACHLKVRAARHIQELGRARWGCRRL